MIMDIKTIHAIKSNPVIHSYLSVDSYWYKQLNRNPDAIKELEKVAKRHFKLTVPDRLERFVGNIEMLSSFIDVLK